MKRQQLLSASEIAAAADRADGSVGGRPTKYRHVYCNQVIDHMAEGASLTSFAAEIGVARSTINEWIDNQPEFSEAVKIGKAKCAAWWEKVTRRIAIEGGGNGSATACIFGLKNMAPDDWREKQQIEHTGKDGGPMQVEEVSARDVLADRLSHLASRSGAKTDTGKPD